MFFDKQLSNSLTLCIVFIKWVFLARLSEILANSNQNYRLRLLFDNFRKISGNIKFPENLQPYYYYYKCQALSDAITTIAGTLYKVYQIKMLHDSCLNDGVLSVSRKRCQISVSQMTDGKDGT